MSTWLEEITKEMETQKPKVNKPAWVSQIDTEINNKSSLKTTVTKDKSGILYLIVFILSVVTLTVYMDKYNLKTGDLVNLFRPQAAVVAETDPLSEQIAAIKAKLEELESYTKSNVTTAEQGRLIVIVNNNNAQALRYGCFHEVVFIDSHWKLSKMPTRVALSESDTALVKSHLK